MGFIGKLLSQKKVEDPMKYLIVGLGNMGAEYDNTRHNVGFEVLDQIAKDHDLSWSHDRLGDVTKHRHKGRTLILLKPSTFMNLSGKAVKYWMNKENIPIDRTLVIVDDINLDYGKIRLKGNGSHGGHNGLKDIEAKLGTRDYPRLRFGIGDRFSKGRQVDYVLGKWSEKEREDLASYIAEAIQGIQNFTTLSLERAMNFTN